LKKKGLLIVSCYRILHSIFRAKNTVLNSEMNTLPRTLIFDNVGYF